MSCEILELDAIPLAALRDPETLADRTKPGHGRWSICLAVCTHLSCVPLGITPNESRGAYGGHLCPCHGSQFDAAGRVRAGPTQTNLGIPAYRFFSAIVAQIDG